MSLFANLPEVLKELREAQGLSQRELAARARDRGFHLTQSMLSQWEQGRQNPTLNSLDELLQALGVGLEDLPAVMAGGEAIRKLALGDANEELDDSIHLAAVHLRDAWSRIREADVNALEWVIKGLLAALVLLEPSTDAGDRDG